MILRISNMHIPANNLKQFAFGVNRRFNKIDRRFKEVDKRFDRMEKTIERVETNVKILDERTHFQGIQNEERDRKLDQILEIVQSINKEKTHKKIICFSSDWDHRNQDRFKSRSFRQRIHGSWD